MNDSYADDINTNMSNSRVCVQADPGGPRSPTRIRSILSDGRNTKTNCVCIGRPVVIVPLPSLGPGAPFVSERRSVLGIHTSVRDARYV